MHERVPLRWAIGRSVVRSVPEDWEVTGIGAEVVGSIVDVDDERRVYTCKSSLVSLCCGSIVEVSPEYSSTVLNGRTGNGESVVEVSGVVVA